MQCVILAGGLGTRMRPLTESCPKTLLPVHDKPFAWYQVQWLIRQGVSEIVYCIGYKGGMIRDFWEQHPAAGVFMRYVDEGEQIAGTAGALRLALEAGALREEFLLHYGDSFLPVEFAPIQTSFHGSGMPALMTVLRNEGRWDRSNVIYERGRVSLYDKRPGREVPEKMEFIDFGLSILSRGVVEDLIAPRSHSDLAEVFHALSVSGRLAGYEVAQRFYEIGSPGGLADFAEYANSLRLR